MKKVLLGVIATLLFTPVLFAKGKKDSSEVAMANRMKFIDSVDNAMKYENGTIALPNGVAHLNVPKGFKYLNPEQSNYILSDLWKNPPQDGVLGMIFPENGGPFGDKSYAFIITYDSCGFVKDDDADKINYNDMLKDIQKDEVEENKERAAQGYPAINMQGWAATPFYDKDKKVLHWAKNLHFDGEDVNTLNYEVRILGRKGILSMNAVATLDELDTVKRDIDKVLAMPSFNDGYAYKDYNSKIDKVAAWTIGGLVAGKILLKVGFWALLGKYLIIGWKFIVAGFVAVGAAIKKFFKGGKSSSQENLT